MRKTKNQKENRFYGKYGEVIKFPVNYGWASKSSVGPHISKTVGMDDAKHEADDSLGVFLKQSGIHTE